MTTSNRQNIYTGVLLGLTLSFSGLLDSCATNQGSASRDLGITPLEAPQFARRPDSDGQFYLSQTSFDWPVDDARITRGFLPKKRKPHLGIDLAAPKGTPILSSHSGTVIYTGREFKGYGKMVMIEDSNGWATLYAHFNKILVQEGQKIAQGEILGEMGQTGRATGVHLHFEIRKKMGPVDPLPYLPNGEAVSKILEKKS